jgi:hypothetical protein
MSALLYVPAFASLCKRQPPIIICKPNERVLCRPWHSIIALPCFTLPTAVFHITCIHQTYSYTSWKWSQCCISDMYQLHEPYMLLHEPYMLPIKLWAHSAISEQIWAHACSMPMRASGNNMLINKGISKPGFWELSLNLPDYSRPANIYSGSYLSVTQSFWTAEQLTINNDMHACIIIWSWICDLRTGKVI